MNPEMQRLCGPPRRHTPPKGMPAWVRIAPVMLAVWLLLPALAGAQLADEDCLRCHGDAGIKGISARGKTLELYTPPQQFEGGIHKGMECVACHGGAQTFRAAPHNDGKPLQLLCASCHSAEDEAYHKSVHGIWHDRGDEAAATCTDCHGKHDIRPSVDPRSTTYKFTLHNTCGKCHQQQELIATRDISQAEPVAQYIDSIHGRALLVGGLAVAPTCNDCHGVHDILPHEHPDSHIGRRNIPDTCGKCHVLVEDIYLESVHGQLVARNFANAPVCSTCHTSHKISKPTDPVFRLESDRMCGQCHQDRLVNYRETFHGKALALGRQGVAACYDCHGHHDIKASDHPESRLTGQKRLETCRQCHPKANENFAAYVVHADHTNRQDYPVFYYVFLFMTLLLVGTFAFFAMHTILWLYRSVALFMSDSRDFREIKTKIRKDDEQFVRFRPIDRFLHGLVIVSFLLLVITGMPLKFYYTDWAKVILAILGGQEVAAVLHRVGAIVTVFYFTVHVLEVLYQFFKNKKHYRNPETGRFSLVQLFRTATGPDSPMPNWQDVKDMIAHNRWFLGKGPRPQFDRWTYWEKFDYLAVFWGVFIIGLSGLIMWFPEYFTLVLPGWAINVALIIHSDEALLAAGFIFTFHFFNVHFRPEKFPMDPVIFSGRVSKEEMLHERRKQYDRWEKAGELEERKAKADEWHSWKWIALPAGFIAFLIGLLLVVLIFYAMISRLLTA